MEKCKTWGEYKEWEKAEMLRLRRIWFEAMHDPELSNNKFASKLGIDRGSMSRIVLECGAVLHKVPAAPAKLPPVVEKPEPEPKPKAKRKRGPYTDGPVARTKRAREANQYNSLSRPQQLVYNALRVELKLSHKDALHRMVMASEAQKIEEKVG